MACKSVVFNIFYENKLYKTYNLNLNEKIIDIKNKILKDLFENKFNYISLENITERIYKDFGKLFFDKGIMPDTNNNYRLENFTIEDRTFNFNIHPKNITIEKSIEKSKIEDKKIINKTNIHPQVQQKKSYNSVYSRNDKKTITTHNFVFNDNDFPTL